MEKLSDQEVHRRQKLAALREMGIDPYPPRVKRSHTAEEAVRGFEEAPEGSTVHVDVVGLLVAVLFVEQGLAWLFGRRR